LKDLGIDRIIIDQKFMIAAIKIYTFVPFRTFLSFYLDHSFFY